MYINEDHLKTIPFIDFLRWVEDNLRSLSHRKKTDLAYSQSQTMAHIINYRMVGEFKLKWEEYKGDSRTTDFWQDERILDGYIYNISDKRKDEIIKEFTDNLGTDIRYLIFSIEDEKPPKSAGKDPEI